MSTVEMGQELLSLEDAAEFLCVSKSTMYRLLDQGKLRGMKAGKQWRFRKEDLLAYMQRGPAALALANVPMAVLEAELAFFADALAEVNAAVEDADDPALDGEAGKIAQLVRRMIWLLCTRRASDLHVEPVWDAGEMRIVVRLRVDGVLHEVRRLPSVLLDALLLEWKRLAGLPAEERERPQQGGAWVPFGRQQVRLRVSIVPTVYGEKLAVRYIPTHIPSLADLGIADTVLSEWIQRGHGLILFTGPTGSGKSTTRAACMQALLPRHLNIMMVEDPVEYLFPYGVTHLNVERYSQAEGVHAVMQQDPDVIAIGEFRGDPELAQGAVMAAETGHLVLTTMHAHDAISPLYDLLDWGVKRSLLAANVTGIVNQRLLRRLCPACKAPQMPDPNLLAAVRMAAVAGGYHLPDGTTFYTPQGCGACRGTGHVGRFALHEYFTFTPALKAAFLRGALQDEFTQQVREQGQPSSFAVGVQQAVAGVTSLEEVLCKIPRWEV